MQTVLQTLHGHSNQIYYFLDLGLFFWKNVYITAFFLQKEHFFLTSEELTEIQVISWCYWAPQTPSIEKVN